MKSKAELRCIYRHVANMELDGIDRMVQQDYLKKAGYHNPTDQLKKIKANEAYKYILKEEMKKRMRKMEKENKVIENVQEEQRTENTENGMMISQITCKAASYTLGAEERVLVRTHNGSSFTVDQASMRALGEEMIRVADVLGRIM